MFQKEVRPIHQLIPMVCNLTIDTNNLWTSSVISSHGKRDDGVRKILKKDMGRVMKKKAMSNIWWLD